jgi:PTH1 family peptidyl-tRNA hydrolase
MADIFDLFKKIAKQEENTAPITWLIVGLGNPGKEYETTRHNAGFLAMDALTKKKSTSCDRSRFHALTGETTLGGTRALLMKPQTYMNHSGVAVKEAADFYKIPAENVLVIYDDTSLEPGRMRIRRNGSAGGHNGIRSIIRMLGTDQFLRVKIGTGAKPADMDLADYVLGRIPLSERADMAEAFERASKAAADLVTQPLDRVMNEYNRKIEKVPEA